VPIITLGGALGGLVETNRVFYLISVASKKIRFSPKKTTTKVLRKNI